MEIYDAAERSYPRRPDPAPASYPDPLSDMMGRMRRVIQGVGWLGLGMLRENIIEPQLGYVLRHFISNLQDGRGCAHELVVI